jgi:hypothetical protein
MAYDARGYYFDNNSIIDRATWKKTNVVIYSSDKIDARGLDYVAPSGTKMVYNG